MSSVWGSKIKISIFGESHGPAIGVTIDGLPAGIHLDNTFIKNYMSRRAPGKNAWSTARTETDAPKILSGIFDGKTTGAPLCAVIENLDARSGDYSDVQTLARPSHADYTASVRYGGHNDVRGGGHFSGRLTAPLVFAGAVAKTVLKQRGVSVFAYIDEIHGVKGVPIDPAGVTADMLEAATSKDFPVLNDDAGEKMRSQIEKARLAGNSVGGVVGCCVLGLLPGAGSPMFDGLENKLASIIFGIPAVKGLEFGDGFLLSRMTGSEANDAFYAENGSVKTKTNHQGGINGGISNGMPITFRAAFKPTPTISLEQQTVNYRTLENAVISAGGRHDPCIVPRAVVCVESAAAIAILDAVL